MWQMLKNKTYLPIGQSNMWHPDVSLKPWMFNEPNNIFKFNIGVKYRKTQWQVTFNRALLAQ